MYFTSEAIRGCSRFLWRPFGGLYSTMATDRNTGIFQTKREFYSNLFRTNKNWPSEQAGPENVAQLNGLLCISKK